MDSKKEQLAILRHSAAHLLAHAVLELYPETLLTIGPATEHGFFYDFLPKENFKEEDLPKIEARMHEIAQRNLEITHEQMPKEQARKLFAGNPFKLELIEGIEGDTVGISRQGDFVDLCRGGHVATTGDIQHFKLNAISGAYWRARRDNKALQRISGTAFFTDKELRTYERLKEEGVGFPFFHPKGKLIINLLTDYLRKKLTKHGYIEIATPIILSDELWKRSGHYAHYKDNMYFTDIDEHSHAIRPMNCPGAFLVYKERPHSYRELPMRLAEFGLVHRHELSGVLHGLMRVRTFTIDDAHILCTPDQLQSELVSAIKLTLEVLKRFGFEHIKVGVSTKPENAMGSDELWHKAETALEDALKQENIPYVIQEGEGAFYGPKIEFVIQDSMHREWQCGTVQVDFFQPENFDLWYISSEGKKERPVIIHRAIYGSFERFFAILLEHYKGNMPFWLSPVQIKILTITDEQKPYAQSIYDALQQAGYRVELDQSSDPISGKIKTAQLEKTPWMLVLGNKEMANKTITLRHRSGKQEFGLTLDEIIARAHQENAA